MIRLQGNEDGTVSLRVDGGAEILNAQGVSDLVENLAALRALMAPEIPITPRRFEVIQATVDPRFWVEPEFMHDAVLFSIRHAGYGWLSFMIPRPEVATLQRLLNEQIASLTTQGENGGIGT